MGGRSIDVDRELPFSNAARTVVLVGRTGNGKSATGNSILGQNAFRSRRSSSGVLTTTELKTAILRDGQRINVIDTPGLFDYSAKSDFIGKEIAQCIKLAEDGIHSVLVVLSIRTRFTKEEGSAILSLQTLFGSKIFDYVIVVFTGGDELEENDETLEDYLGRDCPEPLKEILVLCGNRYVLFDNKTKDVSKRVEQVQRLLSLVNLVIAQNGGRPYTDERFAQVKKEVASNGYLKREISLLNEQMQRQHDLLLKQIADMVELKMRETTMMLEQKLADEHAARLRAEETAQEAQQRSENEIRKLRDDLEVEKGYLKREISLLNEQMQRQHDLLLKQIAEMVELKMRETTMMLEQKLADEHDARLRAEETAQEAQQRSENEIRKLRDDLEVEKGYLKREISLLNEQMQRQHDLLLKQIAEMMQRQHDLLLKQIAEMVELKMREKTMMLEQKLADEHTARLRAQETTQGVQQRSQDEIRKLGDDLQAVKQIRPIPICPIL